MHNIDHPDQKTTTKVKINNPKIHNNVETLPKDEEKETKANAREQTTMKKNDSKQAISSINGPTTRSKNRQRYLLIKM